MGVRSLVGLVVLQACAFPVEPGNGPVGLETLSTLYVDARGIALTGSGESGLVGMNATTCTVDPSWGLTGSDHDVEGSSDTVQGADCGPDSPCDYAVTSDNRVFVVEPDQFWGLPEGRRFPGLLDATLVDGGVGVLSLHDGECRVEFAGRRTLDTQDTVSLPGEACADGATVEPGDGGLFVAAQGGVYRVTRDGHERIAEGAELVAWDGENAVLIAAERDSAVLRALEADGGTLWEVELAGPVAAIDDAGTRGGAFVMVEDGDGGRMMLLDGLTGEALMDDGVPDVALEVRSSADGGRLAVVRRDQVHFFRVTDGTAAEDEVTLGDLLD